MKLDVIHNEEKQRYEAAVNGDTAVLNYRIRDGAYALVHTEVPRHLRGQGYGRALVRQALDDLRTQGKKIVPRCPFVVNFVNDNPEYRDMVA